MIPLLIAKKRIQSMVSMTKHGIRSSFKGHLLASLKLGRFDDRTFYNCSY